MYVLNGMAYSSGRVKKALFLFGKPFFPTSLTKQISLVVRGMDKKSYQLSTSMAAATNFVFNLYCTCKYLTGKDKIITTVPTSRRAYVKPCKMQMAALVSVLPSAMPFSDWFFWLSAHACITRTIFNEEQMKRDEFDGKKKIRTYKSPTTDFTWDKHLETICFEWFLTGPCWTSCFFTDQIHQTPQLTKMSSSRRKQSHPKPVKRK